MVGILTVILLILHSPAVEQADWGFFGHKLANRTAVFTLPSDLIGFYKANIDYIEAHAVDADKRRYASAHEAVRHYIDLDREGGLTLDSLPRDWVNALASHLEVWCNSSDSFEISIADVDLPGKAQFVHSQILPIYYEDLWRVNADSVAKYLRIDTMQCTSLIVSEDLTEHGILPWHLIAMQRRLETAFREKDVSDILRLSADIGHYIGDAHVPLHTSVNYNGQLTGQEGIHAFWESRLPELFADQFELLTGRAEYIEDVRAFFWNIVLESHSLVDSVLNTDKQITQKLGEDARYCYDQRGNALVRTQCKEFARAFDHALDGMVERRLRATIHAIGSAWYTAWVNAGRPELPRSGYITGENERLKLDELEQKYAQGKFEGRPHD